MTPCTIRSAACCVRGSGLSIINGSTAIEFVGRRNTYEPKPTMATNASTAAPTSTLFLCCLTLLTMNSALDGCAATIGWVLAGLYSIVAVLRSHSGIELAPAVSCFGHFKFFGQLHLSLDRPQVN